MSYDLANRLLQISTPVISGNPGTGAFQYDYDTAGRLITQTMPNSLAINYQLDQNGNRIKLTWPDSYFADYVFDELNRLTDIKLNGSSSSAVQIGYDDLSRRTSITYENGTSCAYAYQIDNNMSDLDWTYASESVSYDFDYNNVYQVMGMTVSDESYLWTPSENLITSYASANSLNQYPSVAGTSFSYSNNGNLTAGPLSASYDALNRLTQVVNGSVTNTYWYDPTNRQIQKSVNGTKSYYLNDGLQEIARYSSSGTLTDRFIPSIGLDEVLISISGSTKTYLHKDRLGSVIAESDNAGAVLNKFAYAPFGSSDAISSTGFGYTGQRYDSKVGLYNYRARYYSPALGRFLQPDPIGFAGGMNFYSYVSNDAVNLVDPLGLDGGSLIYGEVPMTQLGGSGSGGMEHLRAFSAGYGPDRFGLLNTVNVASPSIQNAVGLGGAAYSLTGATSSASGLGFRGFERSSWSGGPKLTHFHLDWFNFGKKQLSDGTTLPSYALGKFHLPYEFPDFCKAAKSIGKSKVFTPKGLDNIMKGFSNLFGRG